MTWLLPDALKIGVELKELSIWQASEIQRATLAQTVMTFMKVLKAKKKSQSQILTSDIFISDKFLKRFSTFVLIPKFSIWHDYRNLGCNI